MRTAGGGAWKCPAPGVTLRSWQPREPSAQFKAIDLADAFHDRDAEHLASISVNGRAEQKSIREALYMYTDQLWDAVKARARREHGSDYDTSADPAYAGVAGMRDLAGELVATVHDAIVRAGDDEPGD